MQLIIKPINNKDIPICLKMFESLYLELGEEKESLEFLSNDLINELINDSPTVIFKTIIDNKMIGMISLSESQAVYAGGKFGAIDDMYVLPEYRSQKVGKVMIDKIKEIAKERKWKRINVTAPTENNDRTVKFYEQNGFIFTGPKMKYKIKAN